MSDPELARATVRKVTRRFVPILFLCFIVSFLDRVNVGFAALTMNEDLGLSATAFGLGAGLFFLTYFLFEVPSNLALERIGARRWIARIMFTWGLLSAATAFVRGPHSFYGIRLLLGAAEAGFFPGVIFFLTLWIPADSRGRVVATFMAAIPLANAFGSPVSAVLTRLDGLAGLRGWQWMFLIEALPALLLAPIVLKVLIDKPADAAWLSTVEREWLRMRLAQDARQNRDTAQRSVLELLRSALVIRLGIAYFGITGFTYGLSFFLPQIVKQFGLTLLQTGFVSAIPFAVGAIGMTWWGRRSDRLAERRFHLLLPLALAALGLTGSTLVEPPVAKLVLLCLAAFGVFCALPLYWTVPPKLLAPASAAAGIALINSLGNLSGFVNPYAIGALKDLTGSFAGGLQLISVFGVLSLLILGALTREQHIRSGA